MKKIYLITNDKIWFSSKRYTSNNDLNNIVLNDLSIECDNEIYKNVRKYMISGN